MRRLVYGSLAGLAATLPMTAAMRRLHGLLPRNDRYALPPREIMAAAGGPEGPAPTLLAHFAYGALTGSSPVVAANLLVLGAGLWTSRGLARGPE